MQGFEHSPEILLLKGVLREFFLGILQNIRGAFIGFGQWASSLRLNLPPLLKFFGNTKFNITVLAIFIVYILYVNIKAYLLFAADKRYAKEGEERVPEWRLLAHIWLGGAVGSIIAMYKLRHKTKHKSFTISAKLCLVIDLLLFSFVIGFLGFWAFLF